MSTLNRSHRLRGLLVAMTCMAVAAPTASTAVPQSAVTKKTVYVDGTHLPSDLQLEARAQGRPWDTGKNVEQSSPLGLILKAGEGDFDPTKGAIKLAVNGEVKQDADLADLIWPVADIIAYLSTLWEIQPGDLIYTGTPAGVGAVVEGDEMVVTIDGLSPLTIKVGPKAA